MSRWYSIVETCPRFGAGSVSIAAATEDAANRFGEVVDAPKDVLEAAISAISRPGSCQVVIYWSGQPEDAAAAAELRTELDQWYVCDTILRELPAVPAPVASVGSWTPDWPPLPAPPPVPPPPPPVPPLAPPARRRNQRGPRFSV